MKTALLFAAALLGTAIHSKAQVNSGSDGHDGAFNPTQNVEIDMADHPDGIYHYTSVNIPSDVTVTFKPNGANSPVVWLVQGSCAINGIIDVSGRSATASSGGEGGPGGFRGGNGGSVATNGQGPGGGKMEPYWGRLEYYSNGNCASFGSLVYPLYWAPPPPDLNRVGAVYGNQFILPLVGGSGGGGMGDIPVGGGGGGGAILIASSASISISGEIKANGGWTISYAGTAYGGAGSGGAIRLVSNTITGAGILSAKGGENTYYSAGHGRIRLDVFQNNFSGAFRGVVTQGFQPIIIPFPAQGHQLSISSVAGIAVPANPTGTPLTPDVIVPAQTNNPASVVVSCNNIPLNSEISVIVHPSNGPDVQAVGMNNGGTLAASTATVSLNMPRGGGIIYAKCVSGLAGLGADNSSKELRTKSLAQTGWTADGERFAKVEVTAILGGQQQLAYITESGKWYALALR